ncbi:MAG: hypothetical protein Q9201_001273 [Fulgogasparrea decipioides]
MDCHFLSGVITGLVVGVFALFEAIIHGKWDFGHADKLKPPATRTYPNLQPMVSMLDHPSHPTADFLYGAPLPAAMIWHTLLVVTLFVLIATASLYWFLTRAPQRDTLLQQHAPQARQGQDHKYAYELALIRDIQRKLGILYVRLEWTREESLTGQLLLAALTRAYSRLARPIHMAQRLPATEGTISIVKQAWDTTPQPEVQLPVVDFFIQTLLFRREDFPPDPVQLPTSPLLLEYRPETGSSNDESHNGSDLEDATSSGVHPRKLRNQLRRKANKAKKRAAKAAAEAGQDESVVSDQHAGQPDLPTPVEGAPGSNPGVSHAEDPADAGVGGDGDAGAESVSAGGDDRADVTEGRTWHTDHNLPTSIVRGLTDNATTKGSIKPKNRRRNNYRSKKRDEEGGANLAAWVASL